jgi:hypothetical protein
MKALTTLFALAIFCATACGQTIKALGYNTTNGQIVAATNVVWTNAFSFSTNTVAAQVRTNLSLGSTWLTNTNVTNFRTAIGLGLTNFVEFAQVESGHFFVADGPNGIVFETDSVAAITRTNLGIPLPALTNTNNFNTLKELGIVDSTDALAAGIFVDRALVVWDSSNDDWGFLANDDKWHTQDTFGDTNGPTNATNAVLWINVTVGTNAYKLPLYQ